MHSHLLQITKSSSSSILLPWVVKEAKFISFNSQRKFTLDHKFIAQAPIIMAFEKPEGTALGL